ALQGTAAVQADLVGMQAMADRIAEGEEVFPEVAPAAVAPAPVDAAAGVHAGADVPAAPGAEAGIGAGGEGTLPASVDALLLEILDAEVAGHLATVDGWLAQARVAPTPASDALLRSVHTMNGAFAMTEVPAITDALSPAEAYIRRLLAARGDAGADGVAAVGELAELIRVTVAALHAPAPQVPLCSALAARLAALRDSLPEAAVPVEQPAMPEPIDVIDAGAALTANDLSEYGDLAAFDPTAAQDAAREAGRVEAGRLEAERAEVERVEAERLEAERLEAERAEAERLEAERLEAERAQEIGRGAWR